MKVFSELQRTSLTGQAVEQILSLIEQGVLNSGDKLPSEREMAASMGISRPSLREAIAALSIVGVLESRPGSGTYVASTVPLDEGTLSLSLNVLEEETPFQIMEARAHFEPESAALAALRARPEDLAELRDLLTVMEELMEQDEWPQAYDRDFHVSVARASQNTAMHRTIEFLCDAWFNVKSTHWKNVKLSGLDEPERRDFIRQSHREIYKCIENGDSEGARRSMKKHFEQIME